MAQVQYRCAEHGVVDGEKCDTILHHGHCPECGMPVGCEIV